jgi:hypothetical protein
MSSVVFNCDLAHFDHSFKTLSSTCPRKMSSLKKVLLRYRFIVVITNDSSICRLQGNPYCNTQGTSDLKRCVCEQVCIDTSKIQLPLLPRLTWMAFKSWVSCTNVMSHVLILVEVDSAIKEKKKKNSDVGDWNCTRFLWVEKCTYAYSKS